MRHAARIAALEEKGKGDWRWRHSPIGPEIKVLEVWEIERKFAEDGTEHMTETLLETWNLNNGFNRGGPEEARKED